MENVVVGLKLFKENNCDSVIFLGGGFLYDCVKGIVLVVVNGGDICDYEGVDCFVKLQLLMIVINIIVGIVLEMICFCIIIDEVCYIKMVIVDKYVILLFFVNDFLLMIGMLKLLIVVIGMDVLMYVIEVYVFIVVMLIIDVCVLKVVIMIVENLLLVVEDGSNVKVCEVMVYVQFFVGMVFNNVFLGYVYVMVYQLGGFYNLLYGVCNVVLLLYVQVFNSKVVVVCLCDCVVVMGVNVIGKNDVEGVEVCINVICELVKKVDILVGLCDLNVKEEDFVVLVINVLKDVCGFINLIQVIYEEIVVIYRAAM